MTDINIENIVVSAKISNRFDIEFMAEKIPGCSYNPDEFDGLTMKFDEPKVAVLVLADGRVLCTGAKSNDEIDEIMKKVTKKIRDANVEVKKNYSVQIENVVVSTDFKKQIDLNAIANGPLLKNVDYNPKHFPGLIYKMDDLCTILILFDSGKLVCTGSKTIDDATKAVDMMKEKLSSIGAL